MIITDNNLPIADQFRVEALVMRAGVVGWVLLLEGRYVRQWCVGGVCVFDIGEGGHTAGCMHT